MEHKLAFPLNPDETATSYASRLTRHCGLSSPNDLCLDLGLRWQDYVRGDDALFARLAEIGGADPELLLRWAIKTIGPGQYSILGHRCAKGALHRTRVRVCPECLRDDVDRQSDDGVYRRYYWQLASVRCCARHSTGLLQLPNEKYVLDSYDFVGQVKKHSDLIFRPDAGTDLREQTAFERYIIGRLEGRRQHPFLDGLSLHTATKLCETLGFVMLLGPAAKLRTASDAQMHQAGEAGFEALQSGEDGLQDVLHSLLSDISKMTMRQKSDFGAFYEWLRLSKFHEDVEPIRRIVRDYVFEHYPIPDGFEILGRPCAQRSVYTVEAACKSLGIERRRIGRYLVGDGIAERNATMDGISLRRTLHRADVLRISSEVSGRLSSAQALDFLKIKDRALLDLCELGLVAQELDDLDQRPKYEREKLQALMKTAASRITEPPGSAADLVPAAEVARRLRLRCRTADVLALVFAGKLKTVSGDVLSNGLAGIKVDTGQVRCALPTWDLPGITRTQASTTLRVTYQTINYLIEEGLLQSARMRNPKSRQFITGICDGSVDAFLRTYETLGLLARRYRRPPGPFGCHLEAKGICPLETPPGISWIYERRGLEARLRKIGITCAPRS